MSAVVAASTTTAVLMVACSPGAQGFSSFLGSSSSHDSSAQPTEMESEASPAPAEKLGVEILGQLPADPTSFTQGLEVEPNGTLLVGTGMRGESEVYRRTLAGERLESVELEPKFFGEGITRFGDVVWQLTWQSGVAFKRDAASLEEIERVSYPGEGWGLCSQDSHLVMSDGTDELRFLDPDTFAEQKRISVTLEGQPVSGLNELECVGDQVYANVFMDTDILRIDASSGEVTGLIDASTVPNTGPAHDANAVLNGIAHIPGTDRFYLTGKRWNDIYEVRFVPTS